MKRVRDILTPDNSLFTVFKADHSELYTSLFEDADPTALDNELLVACGGRYASPLFTNYTTAQVVDSLVRRFGLNWGYIKKVLTADYDATKPYNMEQTTTRTKSNTALDNTDDTEKTGIYGFDSAEATESEESTKAVTSSRSNEENESVRVTTLGNDGDTPVPTLIAKELELRKLSFIGTVIRDVSSHLTLNIY